MSAKPQEFKPKPGWLERQGKNAEVTMAKIDEAFGRAEPSPQRQRLILRKDFRRREMTLGPNRDTWASWHHGITNSDIRRMNMTANTIPLQPHQERVVNERQELMFKVDKLGAFLRGETFKALAADEQRRLTRQYRIMQEYDQVLKERIEHF